MDTARQERERSPARESRSRSGSCNSLENKEFKHYKDAILYQIEPAPNRPSAMRSNKEKTITTTAYMHNSSRGRPVSKVLDPIREPVSREHVPPSGGHTGG